jgi:radical SAM superfamily enzyme YgiQ (UPF0313 family)
MKNSKFRIAISYPPLPSEKGVPLIGQNRQFQWFNSPTYIYPMVPSYAATLLKKHGYKVMWDDAIAQNLKPEEWFKRLKKFRPNMIVIESKTPVIKRHWQIIAKIKKKLSKAVVVLIGDHVTAMPLESMKNSPVDFIATGGDYDFLTLNIANFINHKEKLENGIWYRKGRTIKNTGHFLLNHDLDQLPFIDRNLTKWHLYAYKNGNYKKTPGTYIYSARDCWWGRCEFCSWTTLYPGKYYRCHSPKRVLDEIGFLIGKYQVKEIFDDSGTFPVGNWLKEFCLGMIERGYNRKVKISCNMRLNALSYEEYRLMGKAGFRMILYGLESVNQKTLDLINKNLKVRMIEKTLRWAKKAGLEPHVTVMVDYPWENKDDIAKTVSYTKRLFNKGYIDTLQATLLIPYPGTPLFAKLKAKKLLLTENWDDYDQRKAVIKSPLSEVEVKKTIQKLYRSFITPKYVIRKIGGIRNLDDIKFLLKAGRKVIGHLLDFQPNR